jgi:hypothetical protein
MRLKIASRRGRYRDMEDDFDNGKERIGAFISLRRKVAF